MEGIIAIISLMAALYKEFLCLRRAPNLTEVKALLSKHRDENQNTYFGNKTANLEQK